MNKFYFAQRDESSASDALFALAFSRQRKTKDQDDEEGEQAEDWCINFSKHVVAYPGSGEILALEPETHESDIAKKHADLTSLAESGGASQASDDVLYLVDSQLKLFKLSIEAREQCIVLDKFELTSRKNIEDAMEEHIRDVNFTRMCVTNRCLTIKGTHFSLETGFEWDFVFKDFEEENDGKELRIPFSQNMPDSTMQIALARRGDKKAFLVKDEPSSRRIRTFARHEKNVVQLEVISEKLILT